MIESIFVSIIGTSVLYGILGWLVRNLILTRLARVVQHEFDEKLERLRADVRAGEDKIKSLRDGALSGFAARQLSLSERRLVAVDDLWEAFNNLTSFKVSALMLERVGDFEKFSALAAGDEKYRSLARVMKDQDLSKLNSPKAHSARPHVSELAWAIYSAYSAIIGLAVAKMKLIELGIASGNLVNYQAVCDLLIELLPHQIEAIKRNPQTGGSEFMDEIELMLLGELRHVLRSEDADESAIVRADRINKRVVSVIEESKKTSG